MCGIVGYILGKKAPVHHPARAKFMEQAIYADGLRGQDSTGLFYVNAVGMVDMRKDPLDARRFLDQHYNTTFVDKAAGNYPFGVAHNRSATVGNVDYDSAHPYITEHITLVHNGTLREYAHLPRHLIADTDSARIAMALNEVEPQAAHKVLAALNGAYALVWYDARDESLNVARNVERPLSFLHLNNDQLFFASEGGMLSWITYRCGLAKTLNETESFTPLTHYSYLPDANGSVDLDNPIMTVYEEAPYVSPFGLKASSNGWSEVRDTANGTSSDGYYNMHGVFVPFQKDNPYGWKDNKDVGKEFTVSAPTPGSKKTQDRDRFLNDLGIMVMMGDTIEVSNGLFTTYENSESHGKNEGWIDELTHNNLVGNSANKRFKGQLFVDVHTIPIADINHIEEVPIQVDTFNATIRGIAPDSYREQDITLLGVYQSVQAFRHKTDYWHDHEVLDQFFGGQRWKHSIDDRGRVEHPCYKRTFTNRETEMWIEDKSCAACDAPGSLLYAHDIEFVPELRQGFVCNECVKADRTEDLVSDVVSNVKQLLAAS